MYCPNCGSDKIQFSTNTTGKGFSIGNGCCGYILLGPIGLLCGACGSGTSTEEFWICQNCGHRFSNKDAKDYNERMLNAQKNAEIAKETVRKYKEDLGDKDYTYYENMYNQAKYDANAAEEIYNSRFNFFVDEYSSKNDTVKKYKKKYVDGGKIGCVTGVIFTIIGILCSICGLVPVGVVLIGICVGLFLIRCFKESSLETKVKDILYELEPSLKEYKENMEKAKSNLEYWAVYSQKVDYIKRHESK